MSLVVEIKTDAATAPITAYENALAKTEVQAGKTGDAVSKGFGNGSTAAEKAKQSTQSLTEQMAKLANSGSAFAGLSGYFQRQADVLEKIRGPIREYEADLQALDGLLERGAVTVAEYTSQVTKMNQVIGEGPEKAEEAKSSVDKLGEAFETLKLPAVGAGVLEVGHKLAELAAEAERAQDEYTNLTNKAIKFEDANHGQKQIIDDMGTLADSLHTTREKAFELYDTVRDGTDGMRVSYDDQAKMAKEFGLANELAGNSVDQAADSLKRFMYDVASGTVDIRAIKQQMTQVPELAEVWTKSFNTTRTGLLSMVESGKIGVRDLALALTRPSEALDEMNKKATKIADTNAQMMKKWAEDVNIDVQRGMSGIQAIQMKQLGPNSLYTQVQEQDGFAGLGTNNDEADLARGKSALAKFNDEAKSLTGVFGSMGDAWDKTMGKILTAAAEAPELLKKTETAIGSIITKLDEMAMHGTDAWSQIDTAFGTGTKIAMDHAGKITEAKKQLAGYNEALKAGTLPIAEYNEKTLGLLTTINGVAPAWLTEQVAMDKAHAELKELTAAAGEGEIATYRYHQQWKALMTTLNGGELPAWIKIIDDLNEPMRVFGNDMAGLNELLASGAVDMDQYRAATEKFVDALPKPSDHVPDVIEDINFQLERYNNLIGKAGDATANHLLSKDGLTSQFASVRHDVTDYVLSTDGKTDNAPRYVTSGGTAGIVADVGAVPSVTDVATSAKANTAGFESVGDKYDKAVAGLNSQKNLLSADNYAKSLQNIKEQFGASVSPAEKLAKEQDDINELFGKGVLTYDDYRKKLQDIAKEQEKLADSGKDFASGLSRGWHSIRDEANDTASEISSTMKTAFDGVNDDIVSMVTTGTADWGKLASTIEADFAKMALHKIEGSIFDAVGGGASSAAAGVTTGTSAATTMLAAAPGIGAAIGATAAAAIAAGSAASSGASAAAVAIAGSWAGSDTLIHAANGYSGRVGGVGGVDTKLFAAMVSPREHVQISTEEQYAAQQRAMSGVGRGVTIVNKHDTRGELAQGLASADHDAAVINILKRNSGAVQSLLKK